jgi:hypothetical protein
VEADAVVTPPLVAEGSWPIHQGTFRVGQIVAAYKFVMPRPDRPPFWKADKLMAVLGRDVRRDRSLRPEFRSNSATKPGSVRLDRLSNCCEITDHDKTILILGLQNSDNNQIARRQLGKWSITKKGITSGIDFHKGPIWVHPHDHAFTNCATP